MILSFAAAMYPNSLPFRNTYFTQKYLYLSRPYAQQMEHALQPAKHACELGVNYHLWW